MVKVIAVTRMLSGLNMTAMGLNYGRDCSDHRNGILQGQSVLTLMVVYILRVGQMEILMSSEIVVGAMHLLANLA